MKAVLLYSQRAFPHSEYDDDPIYIIKDFAQIIDISPEDYAYLGSNLYIKELKHPIWGYPQLLAVPQTKKEVEDFKLHLSTSLEKIKENQKQKELDAINRRTETEKKKALAKAKRAAAQIEKKKAEIEKKKAEIENLEKLRKEAGIK